MSTTKSKRDIHMPYRASPAEQAAIERNADAIGLSVSAMLRQRGLNDTPPTFIVDTPDQNKSHKTGIWVNAEEHRRITLNGKAAGFKSTSEWLRQNGLAS